MKVLFAASEAAPFAKVGGLADVIGSLPVALAQRGVETAVILPKYKVIDEKYRGSFLGSTEVSLGWRRQYAGLFALEYRGIKIFFVDNEYYFGSDSIYGYMEGEAEKYAFFSLAVLALLPLSGFMPDILHCNDWQTGLLPVLLKQRNSPIKTVMTIHNLQYQGTFGQQVFKDLLGFSDDMFTTDRLEFYGGASFLKGGLLYADKLTTVSPTYREETLTPEYGQQMEGVLACRAKDYTGILNGLDEEDYNPANDGLIPFAYSRPQGKAKNKAALQRELGLKEEDVPLIALVSRLYDQKGLSLIREKLHELLFSQKFQLAVLGTGEPEYERFFSDIARWYSGRAAVHIGYDNALAHRIYAGSDLFLMPSRFEPCGLSQLIAMRYGTLPIVRRTGGLNDTVRDIGDGGWGFCFNGYDACQMADAVCRGIACYRDAAAWSSAQKRAMEQDFSWKKSAEEYEKIYKQLCGGEF